jgi:hypothetical protein
MKNFSDTIWNRTRDLWACREVRKPTVRPRTPIMYHTECVLQNFLGAKGELRYTEYRLTFQADDSALGFTTTDLNVKIL